MGIYTLLSPCPSTVMVCRPQVRRQEGQRADFHQYLPRSCCAPERYYKRSKKNHRWGRAKRGRGANMRSSSNRKHVAADVRARWGGVYSSPPYSSLSIDLCARTDCGTKSHKHAWWSRWWTWNCTISTGIAECEFLTLRLRATIIRESHGGDTPAPFMMRHWNGLLAKPPK